MGKIYTTDIISIGDHSLDAPRMVQIDDLIEDGLHSEAGYLTEESGTTKLTDAEIAEMGYIKTYTDTDTDTNTQLSQAQVGAYATSEGFIKEYTDTNTQLTSAEIAAMGYLTEMPSHNHDDRHVREGGTSFSGVYPMVVRVSARKIYSDADITFTGSTSQLYVGGSIKSPIFYDSNDTNYYLNPAGTSNLNVINATGGTSTEWNTAHGWGNHADAGYTGDQNLSGYLTTTGKAADSNLLDGKDHTAFGATLATYGTTAGASGRIRITAPFNTNSGHMFQITVSIYSSYTIHTYVVGGYMYSSTNNWYEPKAVYSGTGSPDIVVGRDNSGKAYISIANGNYAGVRVHNMTRGYHTSVADTHDPWTVTIDAATPNSASVNVSTTLTTSGKAADSNLLDGINSTSFLRSDADDAVGAGVTYTWARTDTAGIIFTNNTYNTKLYMGGWTTANSNDISRIRTSSGNLHIDSAANGALYLNWYSNGKVMSDSLIESSASLRAPIFYDSNDTNYYVNPGATDYSGTFRQHVTIGDSTQYKPNSGNWGARLNVVDDVHAKITVGQDADDMLSVWYAHTGQNSIKFGTETSHNVEFVTGNTTRLTVDTGGTVQATGSLRAPYFYDSNDTNYFLDPASSSVLFSVSAQHFYGNLTGNASTATTATKAYYLPTAYVGGVQNNPQTYFNTVIGLKAAMTGYWGTWSDTLWINGYAGSDVRNMVAIHTKRNGQPKIGISTQSCAATSYGTVYELISTWSDTQTKAGVLQSNASLRAPIFYDSNNTGYFTNPASTSNLNSIRLASHLSVGGHSDGSPSGLSTSGRITFGSLSADAVANYSIGTTLENYGGNYNKLDLAFHTGIRLGAHPNYGGVRFYTDQSMTTEILAVGKSGNFVQAANSLRAPIFYDSNNTGYYVNPASTSNLNGLTVNGTITGNISGNANTLDNIDSGSFLRSDATDYQNNTIYQRGYLVNETGYRNRGVYGNYSSSKTNHIWSMGTAYKNHASGTNFGNLYGLAYKHTNNATGGAMAGGHQMVWCSNGVGRSAMGDNIWTSGNVKAPLFYDSNNTAYYTNPAGTSVVQRITHINHTTPILIKVNSGYKSWVHHISSSNSYIFAPSTANGGESWDWANQMSISTSGVVTANNFVLSSDKRSKTKIKDLTCDNIDVSWKSFEMKGNEGDYRTGVIAQELEETNPEFVNTDEKGFKSVKYIDLLIAKIAELEARLEKLEK